LAADLGTLRRAEYTSRMTKTQQTFANDREVPIYVSVEPWPECFELEPGEKLTLIWDASESGDAAQVDFINERELVVWPNGQIDQIRFLINGEEAGARSWTFKHNKDAATAFRRR
jgi:hypothetical protein